MKGSIEAKALTMPSQVAAGLIGSDLPIRRSGLVEARHDTLLPDFVGLNGSAHLFEQGVRTSMTTRGLVVLGSGQERESKRSPTHRLVLITDFSSAIGAKKDDRSPNEVVIAYNEVLERNGVNNTVEPLIRDNGAYALRLISGAYLNDLYGRRFENSDTRRVHVVVCDPGVGGDREAIVVRTEKATYVGPNNGVFWEAIKREGLAIGANGKPEVYKVHDEKFNDVKSATFHGREVFAPIGAEIASGKEPAQLTEWLEPFDAERLVRLDFQENQIVEVDGFHLIKINGKMPDDNPSFARVTITNRATHEQKTIVIPTAEKFVDKQVGDLMIYPGSDDGRLEIAASMAVHKYEDNTVKQLSVNEGNPIEPGDILDISWGYGAIERELQPGVPATV